MDKETKLMAEAFGEALGRALGLMVRTPPATAFEAEHMLNDLARKTREKAREQGIAEAGEVIAAALRFVP